MSPVAVGAEEKRVTRCWIGLWDPQESRGAEMRWKLGRGAGGQSEDGGKKNDGGAIGVVVCAGTEKGGRVGGWNTGGSKERRARGRREREAGGGGTRILPKRRAIPGAALNESAFLCPAMLSKCKQRPIIYHPFRKQLSALPLYLATRLKEGML